MQTITAEQLSTILDDEIFPRVEKTSRYLGNEVNATRKDPAKTELRMALAFPDLYDLGLPNLGILILYEILNRQPGIWAERAYMPGLDLAELLRARGLPLFSLESRTPLAQFDCIGFTLQYELCYTNILEMLDLAGIPALAAERDDAQPLIIAGGPCAFNPEPLAEIMDAFAIGDGEDVILEIAAALRETKGQPRAQRLQRLATIVGVYVPSLYETRALADGTVIPLGPAVRKRVVTDLDTAPFPTGYIVPFTQQVHDRASLEVLRGCTQGCRFCQSGTVTRPVRERSLERVRELETETLERTGYEEIALASLSTCDYSRVKTLVQQAVETATPWGAAVSLPSLRLDSFSLDLVEMIQNVRKSGITFAPEAATPRMRAVINKWIPDEELLETTGEVYRRGWEVIKLYFMIGLPTEQDEDVLAIADLSKRVLSNGRRANSKARVNLGISTFVPRPNTPFQWEAQIGIDETQRRQMLLNTHLKSGLKFGRHDAFASFLEGVFARGDRRLGAVLREAWRRGCKMDAWSEHFDFSRWEEAFAAVGIDPETYLRARGLDEPLPWDVIDPLVSKEFLRQEYERSRQGEVTVDCRRDHCHQCGVSAHYPELCAAMRERSQAGAAAKADWQMPPLPPRPTSTPAQKLRFHFSKKGRARFLSHLELMSVWTRALRRAGIPLAYSQGFHPQPKLAFGTALAQGVESEGEYADIVLNEPVDPAAFPARLNAVLPEGFEIHAAATVPLASPALMSAIAAVRYRVVIPRASLPEDDPQAAVDAFLRREEFAVTRRGKKGPRRVDIRPLVLALQAMEEGEAVVLEMLLREEEGAKARPPEALSAVFGLDAAALPALRLYKLESYLAADEGLRPVLP